MKEANRKQILVAGYDKYLRDTVTGYLSEKYTVLEAQNLEEAFDILKNTPVDLTLVDMGMPDLIKVQLLKRFRAVRSNIPVIVLTETKRIPKTLGTIKRGAYSHITKSVIKNELLINIKRAIEHTENKQDIEHEEALRLSENKCYKLLGNSSALNKIRKTIKVIAPSDSTVLIIGETGTGKELVARSIHARSTRANKPFVAINCGAIPKEIIESELFGHKKGAFTGALRDKTGKFELAHNGTLFLDEIAEMSPDCQIKLLRALEEKEFYPVGSNKLAKVDVRIIAATNKDLKEMMEKGLFREDLYYRLNICAIDIPPLRERPEDIISLAKYFMEEFNVKFGKNFQKISPQARAVLLRHYWKGNVRELRNVIERVMLFEKEPTIESRHLHFIELPPIDKPTENSAFHPPAQGLDAFLKDVEKQYLQNTLALTKGKKTEAAKLLKLSVPTLHYRLEKYGLG